MLQTSAHKSISLDLTPMQVAEALPDTGLAVTGSSDPAAIASSALVIYPGEPLRVALQVQSWEAHPLHLTFSLSSTFPSEWCRIGIVTDETNEWQIIDPAEIEIPAAGRWYGNLLFRVPANFFEDQQAIQRGRKEYLELNFRGCLSVYADLNSTSEAAETPIEQVDFELCVRPSANYIKFLPALYQEVDFINRFIQIFEQTFEPVVASVSNMWANLDPLTAPESLLPFLAHWVDWPLDSLWDLPQQRRLIRRAMELYRWRGTRKGLRLYLHLYTGLPLDDHLAHEVDKHISITEPFGQGLVLDACCIGEDAVLGGGKPYHFKVCLRPNTDHAIDTELVRHIIDHDKPAFCTYELTIEERNLCI